MIRNFLFSFSFFSGIIFISIIFLPSLLLPQKITLLGGKLMGYWSQYCLKIILSTNIVIKGKDNMIKDFTYQSQSCIYCNASANIASKNFKRKSKSKIKNFLKLLEQFNDKENILFPNEWKDFKKIFNKKNFARKDCITLPIKALKKII